MKKVLQSTLTLSVAAASLSIFVAATLLYSDGAPSGRSGAPVDNFATCASSGCHSTSPGSGSVTITAPAQYTPGVGVAITVTLNEPSESTGGFQAVVVDAATGLTHIPALSLGANTTFASGNTNYVTHSNGDFQQWTFTWTPDAAESRDVTVYVASSARKNASVYTNNHTMTSTLPVELASFDATLDGRAAVLRWHTESETGNVGFDIQHAVGTNPFEVVGFVAGAIYSTERLDYQFRTENLLPGKHRFRLRQIDMDGTSTVSPQTELTVAVPETFFLTEAYPNPFHRSTTFDLAVQADQNVRVAVFDELGRRVAELHNGPMRANDTKKLRLAGAHLPSGTYFIHVAGEEFAETRSIVLVR